MRRWKTRIASLFSKFNGRFPQFSHRTDSGPLKAKLPKRKPHLADLRPGRQHCQIHDPEYLLKILQAEIDDSHSRSNKRADL